jgi:hypothetical protein
MPVIQRQPVSGRYRGRRGNFEVELRVDVDGARPMARVSADYFQLEDDQHLYAGSMCVDSPIVVSRGSQVTITGVGRSSWPTDANDVKVTILRGPPDTTPTIATLSHLTANGQVRAIFECSYESPSFRMAQLEEDIEHGVQRFESYDAASLPAGCHPRTITHLSAFEDAGIEMVRTREPGSIDSFEIAENDSWSDAELHAAMEQHFSLFRDAPQWAVWMLHARLHDRDRGAAHPSLFGLMFDQRGSQRQGCALFYQGMAGTTPERQRVQLFTCVHELGHSFNLLHSFQKSLARPPVPSRPKAASWMAYPDLFPGGAAAFWPRFAFEFDDAEIAHLRHAFRDDVIMGGNPFTAGAAFAEDVVLPAPNEEDPGLRLRITVPRALPYGVPVTVDFALWGTTREGRSAPSVLGPRCGNVDVEIRKPDRTTVVFEPFLRHCRVDDAVVLRAGDEPVRDSAFIHFGKDKFTFDRPGRYQIRARCAAPGGAIVLSNAAQIDVRRPVTRADRAAAELAFGEEQGILMSLVGSDAPSLVRGNEALQTLVERYPNHPIASVPRLVHATNAAREFKAVKLDGSVDVRKSQPREAAAILQRSPGLEALLRAAFACGGRAALPKVVAELLPQVPTDRMSADILHPYIRSRINEVSTVIPQVLAGTEALPAPTGSAGRRRAGGGWRAPT